MDGDRQAHRELAAPLSARPRLLGVELDAEAGLEVRLIMRSRALRGSRLGKASHERLAYLGRVGARFGGEEQRFTDRFDGGGDDDLVGHFASLAVAVVRPRG